MKIFAKKTILFRNRRTGEAFKTSPLAFMDAPEWVADDDIFGWAIKDGSLQAFPAEETKTSKAKRAKTEDGE